jgi:hypothetical protein
MAGMKYQMFTLAKQCIRSHPKFTDEEVAEFIGAKPAEMEIVRTARQDVMADTPTEIKTITPEVSA